MMMSARIDECLHLHHDASLSLAAMRELLTHYSVHDLCTYLASEDSPNYDPLVIGAAFDTIIQVDANAGKQLQLILEQWLEHGSSRQVAYALATTQTYPFSSSSQMEAAFKRLRAKYPEHTKKLKQRLAQRQGTAFTRPLALWWFLPTSFSAAIVFACLYAAVNNEDIPLIILLPSAVWAGLRYEAFELACYIAARLTSDVRSLSTHLYNKRFALVMGAIDSILAVASVAGCAALTGNIPLHELTNFFIKALAAFFLIPLVIEVVLLTVLARKRLISLQSFDPR